MLKFKRIVEDREPSLSGLTKKALSELENIKNTAISEEVSVAVNKAISELKKIAYYRKKDMENGTDQALERLGNAIDTLFNLSDKDKTEDIRSVLEILDEMGVRFF